MDPVTPDNTRVVRLMGDFRQFMRSAQLHSVQETDSTSTSSPDVKCAPIPFDISAADDSAFEKRPEKRKLESEEVLFTKAKLAAMESKHAFEEKAHKVARLSLESSNDKLQSEIRLLKETNSNLQSRLNEARRQAIKAVDELNQTKNSENLKLENLEKSYMELEKTMDENRTFLQSKISQLEAQLRGIQQENSHLVLENSSLNSQLEESGVLLEQKSTKVETLMNSIDDLKTVEKTCREQQIKIMELEMRLSRAEESERLAKALKDDLERLQRLEIEVNKLRTQNTRYRNNESNVLLMKEKMMSMEEKLKRNESMLEKSVITEMENKDLLAQLNEAKNRELKLAESNDSELLMDLRNKVAVYVYEIAELKTEVSHQQNLAESYKSDISALERNLMEKTEMAKSKDVEIQNLKKREILLHGECTSLRGIMQSYDTEIATPHSEHLMRRLKNSESMNERLRSQLRNVQQLSQTSSLEVVNLRVKLKELESKSAALESQKNQNQNEGNIESLQKRIEELVEENEILVKNNNRLQLWADSNIRRGDFDPLKNRVFHFRMNPADLAHREAKNEVENLREKCQKLQEKILRLESDQDVTTTTCIDTTKLKEMEDKLSSAGLKNQRLKEVFSKTIQDFRQACYTLTGFRIDANDDHFKLTSRYAESHNDYLLFTSDSSGGMQLLETDFSKSLDSLIKLHLHHQNSIPMFLSSLTADLFGQQTVMTGQIC